MEIEVITRMQDTNVLHYIDGLYGYAMALTRNQADAEDLVQETYVRAIRGAESLRAGSNVKNWLFTVLRNIRLNQLRQQRTAPKYIELDADEGKTDITIETSPDPYARYVGKTERERVREAIQQLSSELREIILLREFEELTYREIANLLGCPIGTVMSRLARARSKLRTLVSVSDAPLSRI
jgi:RNA polymerase sigma-70 factor (ECF subfamily)